jgi:hypothetical protein
MLAGAPRDRLPPGVVTTAQFGARGGHAQHRVATSGISDRLGKMLRNSNADAVEVDLQPSRDGRPADLLRVLKISLKLRDG